MHRRGKISNGSGVGQGVLAASPFPRVNRVLHCGPHSLLSLAAQHGTPLYVYDGHRIKERLKSLKAAFAPLELLIAYSVKANSNLALLGLVAQEGAGADIVSGGELYRCLRAGLPASRIVFAGVGKSRQEMRAALQAGIKAFHIESQQELQALAEVAQQLNVVARIGVRLNPDVVSPTHEYTQTGHATAKFGVSNDQALQMYSYAAAHPALKPVGVAVHIGSQIREVAPFLAALEETLHLADQVAREGTCTLDYLDLGGGFGIASDESPGLDITTLGQQVRSLIGTRDLSLIVEPGRFIAGDAGVLLSRVLYVKRGGDKTFVISDAGMTELLRPSHYGGSHPVSFVDERDMKGDSEPFDLVGPVCESGDFLALNNRNLPIPQAGTLLCIHSTGAYGFSMSSNYNSRPRPAELLVYGADAKLVRQRESTADLTRGEATWR